MINIKMLFNNIKKNEEQLIKIFNRLDNHWGYEDGMYRYYHRSFKVCVLQSFTLEIYDNMKILCPIGYELSSTIENIIKSGTGVNFKLEHNENFDEIYQPTVFAFLNMKYFLEMIIKYKDWEPTDILPSGVAAILSIYMRKQ